MNILTAEHLKKSYTERLLFDDADFYLHEGEKVGILGINGTGKSTLLKILAGLEEPEEAVKVPVKKGTDTRVKEKKLKFSYREQRDYETIEGEIAALEEKIAALEESMGKFASDFVKLNEITKEKEEAEALLEEKMERWMYLEELKAKIEEQKGL